MIKKSQFYFICIAGFTVIAGMVLTFYLPDRFLSDANIIINDPNNVKGLLGSYPITIYFYDFFWLNKLPFWTIALIQIPIIFYFFYKIGVPENFHKISVSNIIIWFSLTIISVYISVPSKEFLNILFAFLLVKIFRGNKSSSKRIFVLCLLLIAFGLLYRPYYILIPILAFVSFFGTKIKSKLKTFNSVFFSLLFVIFISLSYGLVKGEFLSESTREALNQKRSQNEDANTMIISPVNTSTPLGESIGILYGYFSVNLPAEGLKFYKDPQVILFVFWQLILFTILFRRFGFYVIHQKGNFNLKKWTFHILFSYFIIQGVFEPDLGSSVRHKIGVLPLIYYAIFIKRLHEK
tara:strand:+ start:4573 stop:5622 length:1050 start_codon:yes stop_codon:yes gene_type:complete